MYGKTRPFLYYHFATLLLTSSMQLVAPLDYGTTQLYHEWSTLDLEWPSETVKQASIRNGSYVPERNLVAGIKVYKNDVYLTIPRWRWNSGQPATLVKVIRTADGQAKLRPYPDWASQTVGDCNALQYVQSMEIDPNTGLMYAIDTGRTGLAGTVAPRNVCPAKIVVFDLNKNRLVKSYILPDYVVSRNSNFMNDIVLDYVNNQVAFAYISDVSDWKLYVYDFNKQKAYYLVDESMKPEGNNRSDITIRGKAYPFGNAGLDGIAMSWDFQYVYYCPLGGYNLYQIPTAKLRNMKSNVDANKTDMGIRFVGSKMSQSDGLAHGYQKLYFGALGWNAVYAWDVKKDSEYENLPIDQVHLLRQNKLVRNDWAMQWVDTFAFDEDGWLWFVSNRLHLFVSGGMKFDGTDGSNVRVWKIFVNDTGYLHQANRRTPGPGQSVIG